jgi:Tfp pilus assembly protein PilF
VRRATVVVALVAVLAGAGCGGSSGPTDRQQIETALLTYYKAFGRGDSGAACNELASATTTALEKAGRGKTCTQILDAALKRPDYAAIAPKLQNARVTRITIANDKASAAVLVPGIKANGALGARTNVPLLKEHGAWKIVGAPQ